MAQEQLQKPSLKRQFSFMETADLFDGQITKETLEKIPKANFNFAGECECAECKVANKINNEVTTTCKLFIE